MTDPADPQPSQAGPGPLQRSRSIPAGGPVREPITPADRDVVARQLGRPPRALTAVAHRCPCGQPDVVETAPRLEDGTPFPTLYYLTCPRANAAASRLESAGRMRDWQDQLGSDPELAAGHRGAHEAYLAARDAAARPGEPVLETRATAGGMPDRVKCLHALAGHSLAAGPGINPVGDRAVAEMGEWWAKGPCAQTDREDDEASIAGSAGDRGAERGRSRAEGRDDA